METVEKINRKPKYAYLIIVLIGYVNAAFCQYRLQPILTYLMEAMQVDEAKAGILLSAFSVLNVFLALPLGVLLSKIGPKKMGVVSISLIAAGSLVGVFSPSNYYLMIVSQLIVGAGYCAISILGPYIIARIFAPELMGRANGIYAAGGTIGQLVMYNLIPRITSVNNLKPAWIVTVVYSALMLVVWITVIRNEVILGEKDAEKKERVSLSVVFKDKNLLMLCIGSFAFMMSTMAVLSFAPTFLTVEHGYSEAEAGTLVSVCSIVGLLSALFGGLLSDVLKTRKWIYAATVIWMVLSRFLLALLPKGLLLNIVVWSQGLPAVSKGLLFTVTGEVIKPENTSIGMSAINMSTGLGTLCASALFGVLVKIIGYSGAFMFFGVTSLASLIGICTIKGIK